MTRPARERSGEVDGLGRALLLALLAGATLLLVLYPVELDDHWWHMLTGRYILEHGTIPTTDPFSFTAPGAPWVNWEWLAGLLMVSAYDRFGVWGLVLLRWLAVAGTLAALWAHFGLIERTAGAPTPSASARAIALLSRSLLASLALIVIYGRVADRPHLYALPLLAGLQLVARHLHRRPRPWLLGVALGLMVPWVLLHPSWPLGVALVSAVVVERELDGTSARAPTRERWLVRSSPAILLLPALLHPLVAYTGAVSALFGASSLREWQTSFTFLHWTNIPLVVCLVLMAGYLALTGAYGRDAWRRPSGLLVLVSLVGALAFVRFTPIFAILAVPELHRLAVDKLRDAMPARTAQLACGLVGAALLLAVVHTKSIFGRPYEATVDPRQNPVAVAAFMGRHDLGGNVLASELNAHAYLAFERYPHVRELIDGRVPQLFSEAELLRYRDALTSPDELDRLLAEHDVEHVAIQGLFGASSSAMSFALSRRRDYELVFIDETSMLWTRSALLDALPERLPSFRFVVPPLIDDAWFSGALGPKAFPRVLEELTRLRDAEPELALWIMLVDTLARHPNATPAQRAALGALGAAK